MRTAAAVALAVLLTAPACGGLTHNHKQGLAVVGGLAVVSGAVVMVDGWECDEAQWNNATCQHDAHELTVGGLTLGAGAALLGWSLYLLAHEDEAPAAAPPARAAAR